MRRHNDKRSSHRRRPATVEELARVRYGMTARDIRAYIAAECELETEQARLEELCAELECKRAKVEVTRAGVRRALLAGEVDPMAVNSLRNARRVRLEGVMKLFAGLRIVRGRVVDTLAYPAARTSNEKQAENSVRSN